jgi:hypothetical protein
MIIFKFYAHGFRSTMILCGMEWNSSATYRYSTTAGVDRDEARVILETLRGRIAGSARRRDPSREAVSIERRHGKCDNTARPGLLRP